MVTTSRSFDIWLLSAMARHNLSGSTLARRLALPHEVVYSWLYGLARPDDGVSGDLADALGVTISELRRALEAN